MYTLLTKLCKKIEFFIINFLELQFFITLISLPILICWGLPISSMSLISNALFTPLLFLFLWTSTIFAASVLIGVSSASSSWILNKITNLWLWMLSFGHPSFLIGFSYQMLIPAIIIVIFVFFIYIKYTPRHFHAILFLGTCFLSLIAMRGFITKDCIVPLNDLEMIAIRMNQHTYLIDCAGLCKKKNYYSHIDYHIIPTLIQKAGITTVDTLILCKPSTQLANAATQLAQQLNVKTIMVTTKKNCYKTLSMIYQNKPIKILPLR